MCRRGRSLALVVMAVAGLAASVTACETLTNRPRDVQAKIEAFLLDVREQRGGSGWSHLQGDVQASYPGGQAAWMQAIGSTDTSGLTWTIGEVTVDDYVGCARVDFGADRGDVPLTFYDDRLPAAARVATSLSSGPFMICATVGPMPWDGGVHGVG